ncbi:hypothetical protein SDJN02_13834, partial [Cucurbita argyrosperma subsp. argyrosperma]
MAPRRRSNENWPGAKQFFGASCQSQALFPRCWSPSIALQGNIKILEREDSFLELPLNASK